MYMNKRLFVVIISLFGPIVVLKLLWTLFLMPTEGTALEIFIALALMTILLSSFFSISYIFHETKKGDYIRIDDIFKNKDRD